MIPYLNASQTVLIRSDHSPHPSFSSSLWCYKLLFVCRMLVKTAPRQAANPFGIMPACLTAFLHVQSRQANSSKQKHKHRHKQKHERGSEHLQGTHGSREYASRPDIYISFHLDAWDIQLKREREAGRRAREQTNARVPVALHWGVDAGVLCPPPTTRILFFLWQTLWRLPCVE